MPSVLLPAPHFEQSRDGACLPACVRMVLAYWKDERLEEQIAELLGTKFFGTPISNVERLKAWNYTVSIAEHLQRPALEAYLNQGIPVIVRVWTELLDYWQVATSHVAVAIGYDSGHIIVNDPALPVAAHPVAWDAFLAAWAEFDETAVVIRPL